MRSIRPADAAMHAERANAELRPVVLPLVLLTEANLENLRVAFEIGRRRLVTLAIIRDDGTIEGMANAVEEAAATLLGMRILARLQRVLPKLEGSRVLHIVEKLFLNPELFSDESAALRRELISVTTLNHDLHALGLHPLRVLRRGARVAAAFQLRRAHGFLVKQIVSQIGCGSVDTLERNVRRLSGLSLGHFADSVHEMDVVDIVVHACCIGTDAQRWGQAPPIQTATDNWRPFDGMR